MPGAQKQTSAESATTATGTREGSCVSVERRAKTIPNRKTATGTATARMSAAGSQPLHEPRREMPMLLLLLRSTRRAFRVAAWRGPRVGLCCGGGGGGQTVSKASWPSSFEEARSRDHGHPRSLYSHSWERALSKTEGRRRVRLGQARRTLLTHASHADRGGVGATLHRLASTREREQARVRPRSQKQAGYRAGTSRSRTSRGVVGWKRCVRVRVARASRRSGLFCPWQATKYIEQEQQGRPLGRMSIGRTDIAELIDQSVTR